MKIFLVYLQINAPEQESRYNYGVGYISAVLRQHGHDSRCITLSDREEILNFYKAVEKEKPEIIAFSVYSAQVSYVKEILKRVKKIFNCFVVCGGSHPSLWPELIVEIPELDAIVRGEGEFPLLELAEAFDRKEEYLNIKNFWFKGSGAIIKNDNRPFIENLDTLPFPDKDSLDYQKIIDLNSGRNRFIFSRGCPFNCTYCSNQALSKLAEGKYTRQLSPAKAIEEIKIDAKKFKFRSIVIDDDNVSLNKKWFYEFFGAYKKTFNYPFMCNVRPGTIDSDMMQMLKECGVDRIKIGLEHGNEHFRKTVLKRDISNAQIKETFKLADKHKIPHSDFIMVGFPYETKKLFLDTVRLCRKTSARGGISIFEPYPGTELGTICEENKWMPCKYFLKNRQEATIDYPNFKKEDIQHCHDIFPFLIQEKWVPLSILNFPIGMVKLFYRATLKIKRAMYYMRHPLRLPGMIKRKWRKYRDKGFAKKIV